MKINYTCFAIFLLTFFFINSVSAQQVDSLSVNSKAEHPQKVYNIKPWIDIPATVVAAGLSLNGMRIIYGRDAVPESEILALRKNNVNSFDRPVTRNHSLSAKSASDKFFYGSMPLPLLLLFDKDIRKDGLKIGLLYLQAMGTIGTIYTTSAMIANRFRPYAYNPEVLMDKRTRGGARNSFFAGHPAVVATSTFFMAKVYADYHPSMRNKWILYALAGSIAGTTGYLRIKAGEHFYTDVIVGVTIGTAVGILIPHIHKNKQGKSRKLTLLPNYQHGSGGFTALYKL